MHLFQKKLQSRFSRKLPNRSQHNCFEIPLILSSDIGLVRTENQDRVAAIYTGANSTNPLFAVSVADGMGGMQDGGECATLALSSFYYALIYYRNFNIYERAEKSVQYANKQVFNIYRGYGGSTLTAMLIESSGKSLCVHLGDTRVYTFGFNKKVERHTVDDSLAEAVGGVGRELLQFIGMGESMQPQLVELPREQYFCAITSDGIHNIEEKTLSKILDNSSDLKQVADRLAALSRWCGGVDNSTSAIFNISELISMLSQLEETGVQVWDTYGHLTILQLCEEIHAFDYNKNKQTEELVESENILQTKSSSNILKSNSEKPKKRKLPAKKIKDGNKENIQPVNIELDIHIGNPDDEGESGVDSK